MPPIADTLRRLLARSGLLIVLTLLGAAGGWLYAAVRPPSYQASAYVVLTPAISSIADSTAVNLAQAYGRITSQDGVLSRARTVLGTDSVDALRRTVRVSTSPDAPLIRITASAGSGSLAAARANAVATSLIGYGNQRSSRTRVRLDSFAEASPPADPASPKPVLDIMVGAAAGLLIAGLAVAAGVGRRTTARPDPEPATHRDAAPEATTPPLAGRFYWAVPAEQVVAGRDAPAAVPVPVPVPGPGTGGPGDGPRNSPRNSPRNGVVTAGTSVTDRTAAGDAPARARDMARDVEPVKRNAVTSSRKPDAARGDTAPADAGAAASGHASNADGNGTAASGSEDDTVPVLVRPSGTADGEPGAGGKAGRP